MYYQQKPHIAVYLFEGKAALIGNCMHSFNTSSVTAANPRDDASTSYHHCY